MNPELKKAITAVNYSISWWRLQPLPVLDHSFAYDKEDVEAVGGFIPAYLVQALRHHRTDPSPQLHEAVRTVIEETLGYPITKAQAEATMRFLSTDSQFDLLLLWKLELQIGRDGSLSTGIGPIHLFHNTGRWRVRCDSEHADLDSAIRTAASFAALQKMFE